MPKPYQFGIHIFRHDLRLQDNEALHSLIQHCERISLVYVFEPECLAPDKYGLCQLGHHRHAFLDESLRSLKTECDSNNIELMLFQGKRTALIEKLCSATKVDCISMEHHAGYNECIEINELKNLLPSTEFLEGNSNYLLDISALPFAINDMPNVFSPFRRKVEKNLVTRKVINYDTKQDTQHNTLKEVARTLGLDLYQANTPISIQEHRGSENEAQLRLKSYFFETDNIAQYKETRNGMDGWDFSSRVSSFLAHGCISPATIYQQLRNYEASRIKNESTYWLFFELLWREFFHLQSIKHGKYLFSYGGIQKQAPNNQHNAPRFAKWCEGSTGYPIVDACMRQLNQTGFMSNRGRQLVASCFVHELQLDWRYGAQYFEQQLVDFDVCSNYGNWQYLAGVGSDPRGHRQFNLVKQTQIYDPQQQFISKWLA